MTRHLNPELIAALTLAGFVYAVWCTLDYLSAHVSWVWW